MPDEIEPRLERLLAQLPEPEGEVGEQALAAALAALPIRAPHPHRHARRLAILLSATLVLLALAAGALAAAGALHVSFGHVRHRSASGPAPQLRVPAGAHGIAAVVDGKLWLTTSGGLRLQGLPVSAAALSPHALYVAAGIGDSLVAMAPSGRRAWSRQTRGRIAAIAWAPDGLRIAYVVASGHGFQLRVIEGNGHNDALVDAAVRPVTPSWRADSLAVAYVAAGGKPVVYSLGHRSRHLVAGPPARDATRLAFAPRGSALAIGTRHGFLLADAGARANGAGFAPSLVAGLGWLHGRLAVAVDPAFAGDQGPLVQLFEVEHGEAIPAGQLIPPARIEALDAHDGHLTIAVGGAGSVRLLASAPGAATRTVRLPTSPELVTLPPGSRISGLAVG